MELSPALPDVVEASPQVRLPASNSADKPIVIEDDDPSTSPVAEEIDNKPAMVSFCTICCGYYGAAHYCCNPDSHS
ncbi:hypothetical protein RRG08_010007 [Elysia crispata]|uniref:Uncharacterized protein n=1 Tax=Elysia crispata TaxID=231223 RepID=A0AAE0YR91_9GAST|nr:hypothetical protein RRG08_010007 [Elysia crispata]